jgi:hypothetical protein
MAEMMGYSHAKNCKSAVKTLFEKLKKHRNEAIAAAAASAGTSASIPEHEGTSEGGEEEAIEEPKAKKPAAKKAAKAKKEEATEEEGEEAEEAQSPKKATAKKSAATKKAAATKKTVGKQTAPKKASGKKAAAKVEENDAEVEADEVDMADEDAAAPKAEDVDHEMNEGFDEAGKSTRSPSPSNPLSIPQTPGSLQISAISDPASLAASEGKYATPVGADSESSGVVNLSSPMALNAAASASDVAGPSTSDAATAPVAMHPVPLEIVINGQIFYYTPYEAWVASTHQVTLEAWLLWRVHNDYSFLGPQPYYAPGQEPAELEDKV